MCEGVQYGMTSRRFRFGWYAPMEDMSLDIRRYLGERLGPTAVEDDADRPTHATVGGHDARLGRRRRRARGPRLGDGVLAGAAAGDPGAGPRAVRDRPRERRLGGRQPDHPALLPPARLRPAHARAPTRRGPRSSARARPRVVFRTGGLDVGPRETAEGVAIDIDEYARAMTAEGVPFERLDGAEIMRRWPAWRLDDGARRAVPGRTPGSPTRRAGNVAHRRLAAAHGAVLREHAPVARIEDGGRRDRPSSSRTGSDPRGQASSSPPTPGRTTCSRRSARSLPLTVTQEQVSWFTPRGDPALFAPERFPVWIWMDEPSFYGFPTHGHPGPKVGQDVGGRRGHAGDADVRARRGGAGRGSRRSSRRTCPAMAASRS